MERLSPLRALEPIGRFGLPVALIALFLLGCGRLPTHPRLRPTPDDSVSEVPVPFGQAGIVDNWSITVLASSLEPSGANAHQRVVPSGPAVRDLIRFTVTLGISPVGVRRAGSDYRVRVEALARSGLRYEPNASPACPHSPVSPAKNEARGAGVVTLCFGVRTEDVDSLMLVASDRSGHGEQLTFALQSTSH